MAEAVKDRAAMIASMAPRLDDTMYHFCTSVAPDVDRSSALAIFEEEEGCSLVLSDAVAEARGFDRTQPMARITLMVHSALDGVGLTAAVAEALAAHDIPCNMVAAFHHDHAFVPWARREAAHDILKTLSKEGAT
jgi:hypothetical protein